MFQLRQSTQESTFKPFYSLIFNISALENTTVAVLLKIIIIFWKM